MTAELRKYSIGMGDRFGREAAGQLSAVAEAGKKGIEVTPVWNKSHREHSLIGTKPADVRREADAAVRSLGWKHSYFVDADHITLKNAGLFIDACDFFTLDVADAIGRDPEPRELDSFLSRSSELRARHVLPDGTSLVVDDANLKTAAARYCSAVVEAGRLYRHIRDAKKGSEFIVEVSMDETVVPQSPLELLCILRMISDQGIPADTVAPRFCGRFNKGVDYKGDLNRFEKDFSAHLAVLGYAREKFGLKPGLKLSMHSGSDKFSLYPLINRLLKKTGEGLHLKTAGTNWLEEVLGLAESGDDGLRIVRRIYKDGLDRYDEMITPYASVVEIDRAELPSAREVDGWGSAEFVERLRHEPEDEGSRASRYSASFRQFLHVSFPVAARLGAEFTDCVEKNSRSIAERVKDNLLRKHIIPLFGSGEI